MTGFESEQADLTGAVRDGNNPFLLLFPPRSIESRKEKKADSGKGVDRETCL